MDGIAGHIAGELQDRTQDARRRFCLHAHDPSACGAGDRLPPESVRMEVTCCHDLRFINAGRADPALLTTREPNKPIAGETRLVLHLDIDLSGAVSHV